MYGMINKALRDMVIDGHGEQQWQEIMQVSGVSEDSFLTLRSYDDAVTYDLVGASSKVLGAPVDSLLEMFGRHWILRTAAESYDSLLKTTGTEIWEFLQNLDNLHDRITTTFADYQPPSFQVEMVTDSEAKLHYRSTRQGLTPFVIGLLAGLGQRFSVQLSILSTVAMPVDEGEHTVFELRLVG